MSQHYEIQPQPTEAEAANPYNGDLFTSGLWPGLALMLQPDRGFQPRERHDIIRYLGIQAGNIIRQSTGIDLPSRETSIRFRELVLEQRPDVAPIIERAVISDDAAHEPRGCWNLPLKTEIDDSGHTRYPSVSGKSHGFMRSVSSHRWVLEALCGPGYNLRAEDHVDHECRSHGCCNPMHLLVGSQADNTRRGVIARRSGHGIGEPTLLD